MHAAARRNDTRSIFNVRKPHVNCLLCDEKGNTPMHVAAEHGSTEYLSLVLQLVALVDRAAINKRNHAGDSALHLACSSNHIGAVKQLLAEGADVLTVGNGGAYPLHLARSGAVATVLINAGALTFSKDSFGATPLHSACARGDREVVEVLLRAFASPTQKNTDGNTPLHVACCSNSDSTIITLLTARGASWTARNNKLQTPLEAALSQAVSLVVSHSDDSTASSSDSSSDSTSEDWEARPIWCV